MNVTRSTSESWAEEESMWGEKSDPFIYMYILYPPAEKIMLWEERDLGRILGKYSGCIHIKLLSAS